MEPPLSKLEQARIKRLSHTRDMDSLRIEFDGGAELIAYNDSMLDDLLITVEDAACEFPVGLGLRVEMIDHTDRELILRLSDDHHIRIGLREQDSRGPEAFQLVLPGYPPIVEQNE